MDVPFDGDRIADIPYVRDVPLAEFLAALFVSSAATPQGDSCLLPLRTAWTTSRIASITS